MLSIYNTLTAKKELFTPLQGKQVNMYTCGVTVYDKCHIGHGRSLYIFEVIRRYLTLKGFSVKIIRNITDVDDKIIVKAQQLKEKNPAFTIAQAVDLVTSTNIAAYYQDLVRLGIPKADIEPKATEHIKEMIAFIQELIAKGAAYHAAGSVYFRVKKFAGYGQLSKRDPEEMVAGARVEVSEDKEDPMDFALWKKSKDNEPSWPSPWGKGRPGWHIECSAMARKYLGDTLDIHGGGKDLVFPHHENECAQSEALTGKQFSRYWIHHGLITVEKQKMAKSLGNFITLEDILQRVSGDTVKIFFLSATYHSPLDYSEESIAEAEKVRQRLMIIEQRLAAYSPIQVDLLSDPSLREIYQKLASAMDDDFNMPAGFSTVFDLVEFVNTVLVQRSGDGKLLSEAKGLFDYMKQLFILDFSSGNAQSSAAEGLTEQEIEKYIQQRRDARAQKKFKEADAIRNTLLEKGVALEDFPDGRTLWRRK